MMISRTSSRLTALFSLALVGLAAQLGSAVPVTLQAKDLAGAPLTLPSPGQKATALIFIAHDCPISNAYAPEIKRIANEYGQRGIRIVLVYAEDGFSAAGAKEHARQYGYLMPAVLDSTHRLSGATGATVTPQAVVLSPSGKTLYSGRIDNRFLGYGKDKIKASVSDLRLSLDAILAGKPVPHPTTTAIGCFIPDGK